MWKSDDPTIGFIGFIRPGFGAIPPLAELQSMLFTQHLLNRVPKTLSQDDEWHYRIIHPPSSRITYGVEHDSYAYQLAKDMDQAPSFLQVLKLAFTTKNGWRLPYVWACGSSFNAKFRMIGPWRHEKAAEVLTGEMWETITRRSGLFGNVPLSVAPMLYLGTINLYYYIYANFWGALAKIRLARPLPKRNDVKRKFEELAAKEHARLKAEAAMENGKMNGNGDVKMNGSGGIKMNGHANGHVSDDIEGQTCW